MEKLHEEKRMEIILQRMRNKVANLSFEEEKQDSIAEQSSSSESSDEQETPLGKRTP